MLKLHTGCMKSGKSKALIEDYLDSNKKHKFCFKPSIDTRDGAFIKSRNGMAIEAILCESSEDVFHYLKLHSKRVGIHQYMKETAVFIDEVMLFDGGILDALDNIYCDIYVSGLTFTSEGNVFGFRNSESDMSDLMVMCTDIQKHSARCDWCDNPATNTVLRNFGVDKVSDIMIAGDDVYGAMCNSCLKGRG